MAHPPTPDQPVILMESGSLAGNTPIEVGRGMGIQTREGHTVGHVAAVVMDQNNQTTHILLQEPGQMLYRQIPVKLVEQVAPEVIVLGILKPVLEDLPIWQKP